MNRKHLLICFFLSIIYKCSFSTVPLSTNCDYSINSIKYKYTAGGWGGRGGGLEPGIVTFHRRIGKSDWSSQSKASAQSSLLVRGDIVNISIAASYLNINNNIYIYWLKI
jgi:hypothetical protein